MLKRLRKLWNPYPMLNWPWNWLLAGLLMRHIPGRQCAWHFNREVALQDIKPLTMVWAEGYYGLWMLLQAMYEKDGVQMGFAEIVRRTRSEKRARVIARHYITAWREYARENIGNGGDDDTE